MFPQIMCSNDAINELTSGNTELLHKDLVDVNTEILFDFF